jgi:DeoR/GlpR family transcriptional regulator of sugar metabolism
LYELTGPLATGVLEQVALDVVILGADGIDTDQSARLADAGVQVVLVWPSRVG